jgi:adenine-specific DNA-methyltransferase
VSEAVLARELGARGSRDAVAGADPTGATSLAAAAVIAAVPTWWAHRAAAVGLTGRWLDVTLAVDTKPPGDLLTGTADPAVTPTLDGHTLGRAYVEALDADVRARHGRHYTPADLAGRVWTSAREALGFGVRDKLLPGLVRDPAAGGGALLIPPLREHLAAVSRTDPGLALAGLAQYIEGIDTDPVAAWLASVVLAAEALPTLAAIPARRRRTIPALVRVGDGLAKQAPARAVLMNPPYGRVKLTPEDRERFSDVLHGHANIYGIFMGAGLASLDSKGVLSALVPTSFASGLYFSHLREVLVRDSTLRGMTFVANRNGVFSGVLQETCIATFSRSRARYSDIAVSNGSVQPIARVASPRTGGPWLLPRRADDAAVAAAAAAMPHTLASVGWKASTGPLVWNRRRVDLYARPGGTRLPVLWGADIAAGTVRRDATRDSLRYLAMTGDRDRAVMALRQPAILVQRTTAPEQTRRLVSADLNAEILTAWGGAVVVENHVNVLRPCVPAPLLDRATLARVLGTPTLDRVMRCLSGSVAVSAYELAALRLPDQKTLARWAGLDAEDLALAVAAAYRLGDEG